MTQKSSWKQQPYSDPSSTEDLYELDEESTPDSGMPARGNSADLLADDMFDQPLSSSRSRGKSNGFKILLTMGLLVAIVVGGYAAVRSIVSGTTTEYDELVTEVVKRSAFAITVTDNGELDSMQNITLSSRVEKPTTILSIVPEGTTVRAPVTAEIDGVVDAIEERDGGERVITVRNSPKVVQIPGLLLLVEPRTIEHYVPAGEHTKVSVEIGTRVAAGDYLAADVVCELDSAEYREKAKQQQIELTQAVAAMEQASENLEIQRAQNESDISAAELELKLAGLDLKAYTEGDFLQMQNELKGKITVAQVDLITAQDNYAFTKRIAKKGYRTQNEVEAARINVTKAEIALKDAKEKLKVLELYTSTGEIARRSAAATETVRELVRVRRKASAALSQYQSDYEARKLTAEVEQDKYARLTQQIEVCTLRAPQEGQVVYAKPSGRSRENFTIEEGATVRERQAIIKLPDMTQMKVEAGIHESRISLVRTGLPVQIRIDAYAAQVFHGVVDTVSSVPTPGRWPNYDLKEYPTTIRLTDSQEKISRLKPGLTAQIEILVKQRRDVLQVPVQSVVTVGERRIAFALGDNGPERRDLEIGESSDTAVEIIDGLAEGEEVVMNPRTHFADQIQELEEEAKAAQKATTSKMMPAASPQDKSKAAKPAKPKQIPPAQTTKSSGGAAAFFKQNDKNGDGKLNEDELPGRMKASFSKADADSNGSLSPTELATFMSQMRAKRQ